MPSITQAPFLRQGYGGQVGNYGTTQQDCILSLGIFPPSTLE